MVTKRPQNCTGLQENFGRINLWSWIDYDRVVYIDADCLVTGSIQPLLMLPAPMVGAVGARSHHMLGATLALCSSRSFGAASNWRM